MVVAAASPVTRSVSGHDFPVPGTWAFDPDHSRVAFEGRHLMVTKVRGQFSRFSGAFEAAETPEASRASLVVTVASLESGFADRDAHLKSADFFDADRYPTITFRSTSLRPLGSDRWAADGDLTIRDVTRPVTLDISFGGGVTDPWGNRKIGFTAAAELDREAWGLTWNMPLETGGVVVSKKIRVEIDVEAVLQ